jgi:hypothetical protein
MENVTSTPAGSTGGGTAGSDVNPNNLAATPILDYGSPEVQTLATVLRAAHPDDRDYLQAAHQRLSDANMQTVYAINDDQPASVTLRENKGSCMQRMAALEALARAVGIATRVRALWTNKRLWFHRLPLLKLGLPEVILYTWPQFRIGGKWVDFDELYEPIAKLAARAKKAFSNAGESVFSAVRDQPVDFLGKCKDCGRPDLDLSPLATDAGIYDTRDELFAQLERKTGVLGRLLFNLLYNGRPIRRVPEPWVEGSPLSAAPPRPGFWQRWQHRGQVAAVCLTLLLLAGTAWLLWAEAGWVPPRSNDQRTAFIDGTPGTELIPLAVLKVLPDMFPDQFQPGGKDAGDWIEQFGFTRRPAGDGGDPDLPVGFTVSNYRPKSGSPSPVVFVGVGCAACHSTAIRTSDTAAVVVYGAGNNSINFLAWVDGLRTVLLDEERMTPAKIFQAYAAKFKTRLPLAEQLMARAWLQQSRAQFAGNLPKYDSPYSGAELRDPDSMPLGPSRTQPFRNLVRLILDRPAAADWGYSKIPCVYWESRREWGQFDGGIHDFHARSAMAAMSSGATVDNMALPEIRDNIIRATDYTMTLAGPSFEKTFGIKPDPARVARGREVYNAYCAGCHGAPGATSEEWKRGKDLGVVFKPEAIGTDPERVRYRHADELADKVYAHFPEGNPFHFDRNDLRPLPPGAPGYPSVAGYISHPLEGLFSRAPYLHNASVPTLAELINLERRRDVFYRGNNVYDVERVGLVVPDKPDGRRYFRYDATVRGNSNRGHDYPWPYPDGGWNRSNPEHAKKMGALTDLLEYLKTL